MSLYPYLIRTRVGDCFPHTNEGNVSVSLPPKTLLSLHNPLPETVEKGRFIVVQPITGSDYIKTVGTGKPIMVEEIMPLIGTVIQHPPEGIPIIMGHPISESEVAPGHHLVPVAFNVPGHSPAIGICAVLVAVAVAAALITIATMVYLSIAEQEQTKRHAMDIALQSQEIIDTEYLDIDTGNVYDEYVEGCDVERRFYANGEVLLLALNDKGYEWVGGSASIEREGLDFGELLSTILKPEEWWETLLKWGIVAAVGVGTIVILIKVVPKMLEKKKGG